MDEDTKILMRKFNVLLEAFNKDFKISTIEDGNHINEFKIESINNDGSEFINNLFNFFKETIEGISNEYELAYNEENGLFIAKVEYIKEEF